MLRYTFKKSITQLKIMYFFEYKKIEFFFIYFFKNIRFKNVSHDAYENDV